MEVYWALIAVILTLVVLLVLLPSAGATPTHVSAVSSSKLAIPAGMPMDVATPEHAACEMAGLSGQAKNIRQSPVARMDDAAEAATMLKKQYAPAAPSVPQDYPRKEIGSCPYSKPMSEALPLSNVPMCIAARPETLRTPPMAISA